MRIFILFSVLALLSCANSAPQSSQTSEITLVLRNVTIVDIEANSLDPHRDVVIVGDSIVAIQPSGTTQISNKTRRLDGTGKFLIPGLWDFHVHAFSATTEEDFALPLYIFNGVTGIRDAGALRTLPELQRIANDIERGRRVGPRIVLAGALIDGPPGAWPGQMIATNAMEGRQRVRDAKALGWGYVKSYSLLSEVTYLAIADEAKRQGLVLWGHIPESVQLEVAIKAGHRSIEHFGRITQACSTEEQAMIDGNAQALQNSEPLPALVAEMMGQNARTLRSWDKSLCDAIMRRLVAANVAVMPSLMVSDFYLGKDPAPDDPRMRSVPLAVRKKWGEIDWRRKQIPAAMLAQAPQSVALNWQTFKMAHDAGVMILAGTDASWVNPFLFHGFTLHDELQRYVDAGLTPQQALLTATVNPGLFLMRDDLGGRIDVGTKSIRSKADLVLLNANPLIDISATRQIYAVVANGRLFDRVTLDEMRTKVEQSAAK